MPITHPRTSSARYEKWLPAGPDTGSLRFFFLEQLLEARRGSWFPTNALGPDEDVNVYLAQKLARFVRPDTDPGLSSHGRPLAAPPSLSSRFAGAEHYRRNADDRLLHLGLFGRGDGQRRRAVPFGSTSEESRARDLCDMRSCYACAASLMRRAAATHAGLAAVMEKLALHGEDYVHVLQTLARRRLGLGARLDADGLADLLGGSPDGSRLDAARAAEVASVLRPRADGPTMDVILDLVLELRNKPAKDLQRRLANLAEPLHIDAQRLIAAAES